MTLPLQLFVQTHADVLGLNIILPKESESVLLGSAMLAASAALKEAQKELQVRNLLILACSAGFELQTSGAISGKCCTLISIDGINY